MRTERLKKLRREWEEARRDRLLRRVLERGDVEAYKRLFKNLKQEFGELSHFWRQVNADCTTYPDYEAGLAFFDEEANRVEAEGLKYLAEAGDKFELFTYHFCIASSCRFHRQFDQALFHLETGLSLYKELGIAPHRSDTSTAADIYFHCGQYDKLIPFCDELISKFSQSDSVSDIYEGLQYEGMRARALKLRSRQPEPPATHGGLPTQPCEYEERKHANPAETPTDRQPSEIPETQLPPDQKKLETLLLAARPSPPNPTKQERKHEYSLHPARI